MLQNLCGEDALGNVILGTTKWAVVPNSALRFKQLLSNYWKPLIKKGARALCFKGDLASAWELVDALLELRIERKVVLHIQIELVDQGKTIPETDAGKMLLYTPADGLAQRILSLIRSFRWWRV